MSTRRWKSPWSLLFALTLFIVVADQISKRLAIDALGPDADRGPVNVIPGFLELRYVENTGAAFGILQDSTTLLIFVSFGVVFLLAWVFWRLISQSLLLATAFGLQFGGAVGNLIDRVRLGYVVDFVDVPLIPVFNVADAGITVGVTLLVFVLVIKPDWIAGPEREDEKRTETADNAVEVLAESRSGSEHRSARSERSQESSS